MNARTLLAVWLLSAALLAQGQPTPPAAPTPDALQTLLQQLRSLDAAAWQQRLQHLDQQAGQFDQQAAAQRAQARQLDAQANDAAARAKALRAERQQLDELRRMLQALPIPVDAKPPTTPPAPAAPAAPAGESKPKPAAAAPMPAAAPAATPAPAAGNAAKPATGPTAPAKAAAKDAAAPSSASPAAPPKAAAKDAALDALPVVTWADVEPLFAERCAGCHDPDSKKGGFDVSSFAAALQGGGSGKSIVPGNADQSRLYRMIAQQERPFMPKDADPLDAKALAKVQAWIEQGAAEDAAAARAFVRAREAKNAAAAAAVEASLSGPPPMPEHLPAVPLRTAPRPVPIPALARSPRAPLLALPGLGQVLLLDGVLQTRFVLPCELPRLGAVAFSFDGKLLAVAGGEAGRSGRAVVYDVVSGKPLGPLGKQRDVPLAVAVHAGRRLVALGGSQKHVHVHDLDTGAEVLDGKHDDFVLGLEFSPDGNLLAAADRSGAIVLWETDGGRIAQTLRVPKGSAQAIAFHRSGRTLAAAASDGSVRVFALPDGKEAWAKPAHQGEALALAFGPGDRLVSGGSDGRIALWSSDGKALGASAPVGDQVQAVAFGDREDVVVGGDALGRLHRFDAKAKQTASHTPLLPQQ